MTFGQILRTWVVGFTRATFGKYGKAYAISAPLSWSTCLRPWGSMHALIADRSRVLGWLANLLLDCTQLCPQCLGHVTFHAWPASCSCRERQRIHSLHNERHISCAAHAPPRLSSSIDPATFLARDYQFDQPQKVCLAAS